jgi:hypothetical protein
MHLSSIEHLLAEARLNSAFGADDYDRLFSGMRIGPVYNGTLYIFVCGYLAAEEIKMLHLPLLSSLVEAITAQKISDIYVLPRMSGNLGHCFQLQSSAPACAGVFRPSFR